MMSDQQKIRILWAALAVIDEAVSEIDDMDALRAFVLRKTGSALSVVPDPGPPEATDEGQPL